MDPISLDKDLLLSVMKPARYIGGEIGSVKKDWDAVDVRVCLCFPDVYEIGMSHLGLRLLYDLINRRGDALAERAFAPWMDMEERMRARNLPLWSLESRRPVAGFDILGFSLQYELSYTNVLNVLSLAGIPLRRDDRDGSHPLVIAGGVGALTPEPMAPFIDAFLVGEAEEAIGDIIDAVRQHKSDRPALLDQLARIPGLYVPSRFSPGTGRIAKRVVRRLDGIYDLRRWVVPFIEIVHDRIGIEIMRGCPHRCRFCQARACFFPLRLLDASRVVEIATRLQRQTGYEEISLLSLSSSDHPQIARIARELMASFADKGVSLALPSVRARSVVGDLSELFARHRKTSLTFAPEAGSERLRQLLEKDMDLQGLFDAARQAFRAGYRLLKLYFMIGLPTETSRDLDAIADVCVRLSRMKKEIDAHPARLHVSLGNFVPKPHTPLERAAMASTADLRAKQEYLKGIFRKHRGSITLKFHDPDMSAIEAVLGRGDRRIADVIERVHSAGGRFDAWENHFQAGRWQEAITRQGLDIGDFTSEKPTEEPLPWSFIDVGVKLV